MTTPMARQTMAACWICAGSLLSEPRYRPTAASVLKRDRKYDEALKQAQTGLALSDTDAERRRATDLIDQIARAKG